jgi:hypothetical protein
MGFECFLKIYHAVYTVKTELLPLLVIIDSLYGKLAKNYDV